MAEQKILSSKVWCPSSGFVRKDKSVIEPHKIQLMLCGNGSLYAWCPSCHSKVFIQNKTIVYQMLEVSTVLQVRKKMPASRRREDQYVAS